MTTKTTTKSTAARSNSLISLDECIEIVKKASTDSVDIVDYQIIDLNADVTGYLGEYFRLKVTLKNVSRKKIVDSN